MITEKIRDLYLGYGKKMILKKKEESCRKYNMLQVEAVV